MIPTPNRCAALRSAPVDPERSSGRGFETGDASRLLDFAPVQVVSVVVRVIRMIRVKWRVIRVIRMIRV